MKTGEKTDISKKLEEERNLLMTELKKIGLRDPKTKEWEATPEEQIGPESDENDLADRFEDYEERTALVGPLEGRLNEIDSAIAKLKKGKYGICEVCKKPIEPKRLNANVSARTCIEHMNIKLK